MADTVVDIYCPACGKRMNKIYIRHLKINVDICDNGCGGIYFDNREFEKFDEEHENADEILSIYENQAFQPRDDKELRICPNCKTRMVKLGSGTAKNQFKIDTCYTCGAKFLDGYELQQIRNVQTTDEENQKFFQATFHKVSENANYDLDLDAAFDKGDTKISRAKKAAENVKLTEERRREIAEIIAQIANS